MLINKCIKTYFNNKKKKREKIFFYCLLIYKGTAKIGKRKGQTLHLSWSPSYSCGLAAWRKNKKLHSTYIGDSINEWVVDLLGKHLSKCVQHKNVM